MRASVRGAIGLLWVCLGQGCGASAAVAPHPSPLPEGETDDGWTRGVLGRGVRALVGELVARGPDALVARRLHGAEVEAFFTDAGRARVAQSAVGLAPPREDRRWTLLRTLAREGAGSVEGFCARGVRVVEPGGPEGFRSRELTVERLLVVGRDDGGRWGMWLEALVWTAEGLRFLPWVPYSMAMEVPRRDHLDVALWDCDLEERPREAGSEPQARSAASRMKVSSWSVGSAAPSSPP